MSGYRATITLGDLDLHTTTFTDGFRYKVLAEGFEPGSPQAVRSVVSSMLLDGDDERIDRYGNKPFPFRVQVEGLDLAATRRGARLLDRTCAQQRLPLRLGMEELTEISVYDTVAIEAAAEQFNDLEQVMRSKQTWGLNISCLPWARPENPSRKVFTTGGSTGLLAVPVGGSRRTHAKVRFTKAGGSITFNDLYCYSDPTMATNGWNPGDPTTWKNCPAGPDNSYTLWADFAAAAPGTLHEVTVSNVSSYFAAVEKASTRRPQPGMAGYAVGAYIPVGLVNLGGVYDPILGQVAGPLTFAPKTDGAPVSVHYMLTRNHPDASFSAVVITTAVDAVDLMPPRLGRFGTDYDGVVFESGGVLIDATDRVVAHRAPVLTPDVDGQSLIWVSSNPQNPASMNAYKIEMEWYERHNGWVAAPEIA